MPAEHEVQASTLDAVEYLPTAHGVQMLAPTLVPEFVIEPAAHAAQSLAKAEPVVSTYVPAPHSMHVAARLDAVEYFPTAHNVHVVAPVPAPLSVIEPAAQAVHCATSDAVE